MDLSLDGVTNATGEIVDAVLLLLDQRSRSGTNNGILKRVLKISLAERQQPTPRSSFCEAQNHFAASECSWVGRFIWLPLVNWIEKCTKVGEIFVLTIMSENALPFAMTNYVFKRQAVRKELLQIKEGYRMFQSHPLKLLFIFSTLF